MSLKQFQAGVRTVEAWDRVFRAVAAEPRRQLIVSLMNVEPAEHVELPFAAINPNIPVDTERFVVQLHHRHLPLLADLGFIEWKRDPLLACQGPKFDEVAIVFEALHAKVEDMPNELVFGCRRLEAEREERDFE